PHNHDHGDADRSLGRGLPDPHYWTSVSGMRTMARNMARALSVQNPDSAKIYTDRLAAVTARLDSIDSEISNRVAKSTTHSFAIWHPSLSYFANDYGLEQVPVGMDNKEMSARQLREVIDHARGDSIRVFFFQKEYDRRQAETINEAIGSRIVTVDPLDYDWDDQMIQIADELARP
ncbi:MAG: zinc ABC transporter substrate-binding protein, partial [Muribaculaceae bacterium]|nr:zinc ABC transporter substrate-binding protein [Muribaculaceae bacterium]